MSKGSEVVIYGDYGRDKDGKRIRKKFTGADEFEARFKKAEYEKERALGLHRFSDRITVREWTEIWMNAYRSSLRGTNKVSYDTYVGRLNELIGGMKMRDVRNIHLYRALMSMDGMSKSSLTKFRMVIQQIFKKARQNKVIQEDPGEDLELPDHTSGTHRALDRWEIDMILQNWQAYNSGLWMMLMLLAGLRRGEMIALDWDQVDMKRRLITVWQAAEIVSNAPVIKNTTKTEAGMRVIPICDPLFAALNTIPEDRRSGPVCTNVHGRRLTQSSFVWGMKAFNMAMERLLNGEQPTQAGRRSDLYPVVGARRSFKVRAHDLRFTFATLLHGAGVDARSAMYYLGHSDIRMTMNLYTQFSKEKSYMTGKQFVSYVDDWLRLTPPPTEDDP